MLKILGNRFEFYWYILIIALSSHTFEMFWKKGTFVSSDSTSPIQDNFRLNQL